VQGLASLVTPFGGYRPVNWIYAPQQYSLTCTLPSSTVTSSSSVNGVTTPGSLSSSTEGQTTTYYFDAVMVAEHVQEAMGTKHPVQVGPAIVDHVYLQPAQVTLQVKMSDAMQSFVNGQYSSVPSKSVSAYQQFLQIQASRVPITLVTRLNTYQNMWIASIRPQDDARTVRGFNGLLRFEQIISASITSQSVSARPNTTNTTNSGNLSPGTPTSTEANQVGTIPTP
jgi:hypothetical protein